MHARRTGDRATSHRVDPGLRLIVNFLAQVVTEAAASCRGRVPFYLARNAGYRSAVEFHQADAAGSDFGEFAVFENHGAPGVLQDRGDIGGDEILGVAEAEHQRRRGLCGDQFVGLGLGHHHD